MVEVQIKRVDMYDVGNSQMIVDTILYNPNPTDIIVGIDIYVPSPYGNITLNLTESVHIDSNSSTVFRSNPLKFVPEVTVGVRREYSEEEESIMVGNFVSGTPPDISSIEIVNIGDEIGLETLVTSIPLTLQVERINMFDGAPTLFYGSYIPNTKISIYNDDTKKVLITTQTDNSGKYSVNNDMVFGQSGLVTFNIRSCVTKVDNTLDLTRISNLVTMTIKPVSVVKYPADARYTGLRDRENGTISIPTKNYPSKLDALSALKTKAEQLVADAGGTLLRFEYGYTLTTNYHIYDVTYYYSRNISSIGNNTVGNYNNMENRIYSMWAWWIWLLFGIAAAIIILEVIIRSGLKNLLPTWLQDKIVAASDFLKSGVATIATGITLVAIGYVVITFGPPILNYLSARKTEKAFKRVNEPKRLTS